MNKKPVYNNNKLRGFSSILSYLQFEKELTGREVLERELMQVHDNLNIPEEYYDDILEHARLISLFWKDAIAGGASHNLQKWHNKSLSHFLKIFSKEINEPIVDPETYSPKEVLDYNSLTRPEQNVLGCIAMGRLAVEVARELMISQSEANKVITAINNKIPKIQLNK